MTLTEAQLAAAREWLGRKRTKSLEGTVWVGSPGNREGDMACDLMGGREHESLASLFATREDAARRDGFEECLGQAARSLEAFAEMRASSSGHPYYSVLAQDLRAAIRALPTGEER